jgi:hypothetical protein
MMKLRSLGMMLTLGACLAAGSSFAGDADVWLVNKTGYPISQIYLSATHQNQWGSDRLQDNAAFETDNWIFLKFGARLACAQDIKVVFEGSDTQVVWENLDVCQIDKLTLKYDQVTKTVTALKQ